MAKNVYIAPADVSDNIKQMRDKFKALKDEWATISTDEKLLRMRKLLGRLIRGEE